MATHAIPKLNGSNKYAVAFTPDGIKAGAATLSAAIVEAVAPSPMSRLCNCGRPRFVSSQKDTLGTEARNTPKAALHWQMPADPVSLQVMLNIVLLEPEIPPNTGNIGRLCLATGSVLHLVEPLGFSLDDKQLKRAGLDYWEFVKVRRWANWAAFTRALPADARLWYLTTKTNVVYWDVGFEAGDYLVFGRETRGLPAGLLEANPERCLTIPMEAETRSLNLATAVGIVMYEATRQLRSAKF